VTSSLRPEYTAEQVEESRARLESCLGCTWSPYAFPYTEIRTILSEVKRLTLQVESAEAENRNARTALGCKDDESLWSHAVSLGYEIDSLRSRLESAERDTAIVDWMLAVGFITVDGKAPDVHPTRDNLRSCMEEYAAHSPTPTQGGTNG
jgi:hypothetical protein